MRVGGRGRFGSRAKWPDAEPTGRARGARGMGRPRDGAEAAFSASSSEVLSRSSDAVRSSEASSRAKPKRVVSSSCLTLSPISPSDVVASRVRDTAESCVLGPSSPRRLAFSLASYCKLEPKHVSIAIHKYCI